MSCSKVFEDYPRPEMRTKQLQEGGGVPSNFKIRGSGLELNAGRQRIIGSDAQIRLSDPDKVSPGGTKRWRENNNNQ